MTFSMPNARFDFGSAELARTRLHAMGLVGAAATASKKIRPAYGIDREASDRVKSTSSNVVRDQTAGHRDAIENLDWAQSARYAGQAGIVDAYDQMFKENPGDPWLVGIRHPLEPARTIVNLQDDIIDSLDTWNYQKGVKVRSIKNENTQG